MARRRFAIPTRKTVPRHEYAPPPRRRLAANPTALAALFLLTAIAVTSLAAPLLSPYDPIAMDPAQQFMPPSREHPAGTDLFGRDVATRVLYGGRYSLGIGLLAVLMAVIPGTGLGLLAGYFGKRLDTLISWLVNVMLAFPGILLALTLIAVLGTGAANVVLAVGIAGIPNTRAWSEGRFSRPAASLMSVQPGQSGAHTPAYSCATSCPTFWALWLSWRPSMLGGPF